MRGIVLVKEVYAGVAVYSMELFGIGDDWGWSVRVRGIFPVPSGWFPAGEGSLVRGAVREPQS